MGHRSAGAARIGVGAGVLGALLAAMAAAAGAGADASTATASLSIAPPSQTVDAGDTVTIEVSVNNVTDMAAWEFVISYDPVVLDYTGATADKTMLQPVGSVFCPGVIGDEVAGTVTLSCGTFGNAGSENLANGADGSGKLGTVTFAAKAAGKSPVVFTKVGLARADASSIAVTGSTAMVCVDACSGLEPTPTYNPSLLTPTAVSGGGSQYDSPDEADPNAPAGGYPTPTPRAGTSRPATGGSTTGGSTTGGTTSGTLAGSTVRAGSGSAAGASGATDGNGFPVAGTGADAGEGGFAWPAWIIISGSAGLALLSAGALTSRRGSA